MSKSASIRRYVKSIPVVGTAAQQGLRAFNTVVSSAYARIYHGVRRVKHGVRWNLVHNPRSHRLFLDQRPVLTGAQQELVENLATRGIAITTIEDVGGNGEDWVRLRDKIEQFSRNVKKLLDDANHSNVELLDFGTLRHNIDRFRRFFGDQNNAENDDYIVKMNPENSVLHADDPLIAVGLSRAVLNIVNSYFGLWSKMTYVDAWHSIPITIGRRIGSQRWHRDGEDWKMVKVYLYCADVDEDAGAMEFIPGTTYSARGLGQDIVRWTASGGGSEQYPTGDRIEQCFPSSARIPCKGLPGTLVFCDTTGFHRGGLPRSKPRILATWTYVTPASLSKHRFTIYPGEVGSLSEEGQFAVCQ
jgi:Phytanoyl-CoA dioxygenase (PhyH)